MALACRSTQARSSSTLGQPGRRDQAGHDRRRGGPQAAAVRDGVVTRRAAARAPHTPRSASPTSADRMIKWLSSRGIRSAPSPDTSITKPDGRTVRSTCSRQSRASPRQSKPGPRLALVADTATVTARPTSTALPTLVS